MLEVRIAPATFTVLNFTDSGPGSLRQAILDANASPGTDEIHFNAGGRIQLATALPTITEDLDILATTTVTIDGRNRVSLLSIEGDGVDVTIERLKLTRGFAGPDENGLAAGAAIKINAPGGGLVLRKTIVTGNLATADQVVSGYYGTYVEPGAGVSGGAMANFAGHLRIEDSSLTNNKAVAVGATGSGGAIFNADQLTVTGSVFSGNRVLALEAQGGAIFSAAGSVVAISESQLTGNAAQGTPGTKGSHGFRGDKGERGGRGEDGGDGSDGEEGSGGTDGGSAMGGAVANFGELTLSASVVSGNAAKAGNGGKGGQGGKGGAGGSGGAGYQYYGTFYRGGSRGYGGSGGSGGYGGSGGGAAGGGVYNGADGAVTIVSSSISKNSATAGVAGKGGAAGGKGAGRAGSGEKGTPGAAGTAGDAEGGGIWNAGELVIAKAESGAAPDVSINFAKGKNARGGGIANVGDATSSIEDATVSKNKVRAANGMHGAAGQKGPHGARGGRGEDGSDGEGGSDGTDGEAGGDALGGGIYNLGATAVVRSIISGNVAKAGHGGRGGNGGGGGNGGAGGSGYTYYGERYPAGSRGAGAYGGNGGSAGDAGRSLGGGLHNESAEILIDDGQGGLIMSTTEGDLTVQDCTISGNRTIAGQAGRAGRGGLGGSGSGGRAEAGSPGSPAELAEGGGGGISSLLGRLLLESTAVTGNNSDASGGGVSVIRNIATTISGGRIEQNKAKLAGGGLFVELNEIGDPVELVGVVPVVDNQASTDPNISGPVLQI